MRVVLGTLETCGARIPGEKTADAAFGAGGGGGGGGSGSGGGGGGAGVAVASDGGRAPGGHVPGGGALGCAAPPTARGDIASADVVVLVVFPANRVGATGAGSGGTAFLDGSGDDWRWFHVLEESGEDHGRGGVGADDSGRGLESWDGVVAQTVLCGLRRLPAGDEGGGEDVAIVGAGGGGGGVENYGGKEGTRVGDAPPGGFHGFHRIRGFGRGSHGRHNLGGRPRGSGKPRDFGRRVWGGLAVREI